MDNRLKRKLVDENADPIECLSNEEDKILDEIFPQGSIETLNLVERTRLFLLLKQLSVCYKFE